MKKINECQKKAIKTIKGPVLIIAGPGSGKTFTLVERVVHMVADLDINPSSIMISTFTNKASRELLDRLSIKFSQLNISKDVNDMLLSNFHGICGKILDQYIDFSDLKPGYKIIDDVQKKYLITKHLDKFRRIPGYFNIIQSYDVNNIESIIKLVFEDGILIRKSNNPTYQTILDISSLYEKMLKDLNVIDFSAVLYFTYKMIAQNEEVRMDLMHRIKYIMIDEYQDTNKVQEKILFSLLDEEENICVVGDDDQGLYRFRGATVKNILNFGHNFKNKPTVINLNTNYRSTSGIISFYSTFMDDLDTIPNIESYRYKKDLKSADMDDYQSVFKLACENEGDYKNRIIETIKSLKENQVIRSYNEVAILVSSVNDSRINKLDTALRKQGIGVYTPKTSTLISRDEIYQIIGGFFAIFKDRIVSKNLITDVKTFEYLDSCYTKFFKHMSKDNDTAEFIDQMSVYINSEDFNVSLLDLAYRLFRYQPFEGLLSDKNDEKAKKNISRFLELIESFSYTEFLYYVNNKNVDKFCNLFFSNFIGFIKDQRIAEFEEDTVVPDEDSISMLTIHSSKGMEYPVVIMASLWDTSYKTYSHAFSRLLEEMSKALGKETFEPKEFMNKLDFYRKYFTGFSRAENLLLLAGIENSNNSFVGKELSPHFRKLEDFSKSDIDKIRRKEAKENETKQIYSYTTDIIQYRYCPKAYYFFRKLKYPKMISKGMVYGSIVHETIEFINKSVMVGEKLTKNEIDHQIREIAKNKYKNGALFINKDMLSSIGLEIDKYLDFMSEYDEIIGSEVGISVAKAEYLLTGNVDMVYKKDKSLNILDFKTGTNPLEAGNDDLLNQYVNQLNLYSYLYQETKKDEIDSIALYFTSLNNKESFLTYEFNKNTNVKIMEEISLTISKIENDTEYLKTDDISKCKNCEMRFYCNRV